MQSGFHIVVLHTSLDSVTCDSFCSQFSYQNSCWDPPNSPDGLAIAHLGPGHYTAVCWLTHSSDFNLWFWDWSLYTFLLPSNSNRSFPIREPESTRRQGRKKGVSFFSQLPGSFWWSHLWLPSLPRQQGVSATTAEANFVLKNQQRTFIHTSQVQCHLSVTHF